ncbi:hypothetical protein B0H13DRAFT_1641671, partial [Mycena leptocephala]
MGTLGDGKKAYRLLDVETKVIFHSRHVRFNEDGRADSTLFTGQEPSLEQWE